LFFFIMINYYQSLLMFSILVNHCYQVFRQFIGNLVLGQNDSNGCNCISLRVGHSFVTPFHLSLVILVGTSFKCYNTYILCLSECNITASGLFSRLGTRVLLIKRYLACWGFDLPGCWGDVCYFLLHWYCIFKVAPTFLGGFNLTQHCI